MGEPKQNSNPEGETLRTLAPEMFEALEMVLPLLDAFDGEPWLEAKVKIQGILAKLGNGGAE